MVVRPARLIGTRAPVAAGCTLVAGNCHAAAPIYFDLGGLIAYGALYVFGFVVLLVLLSKSRRKAIWSCILLAYVASPVTYFMVISSMQEARNDRILEQTRIGTAKNVEAFAAYCKDRKRVVNKRVPRGAEATLLVRQDQFTGIRGEFNAYPIHAYMVKDREICQKTGLGYLEGIYDGRYVAEKKGYEREVRLYRMCRAEKWTATEQSQARYELVLGESSERKPVPWGGGGGRWMSRSSVRVIDKHSGTTLAEDTMYFLRYETGGGGCPKGVEQLASLIADVFPKE